MRGKAAARRSVAGFDKRWAAVLVLATMLALIVAVRLYYYTGPIFANSQDEGIYLNIIKNGVINHQLPNFAMYKGANFSNFSDWRLFASPNIFQFYATLIYPEIFLLSITGFNADYAIGYVIFTSMVEGLFIMLILLRLSSLRAAAIGGVLFAFFPVDVLFSTHVQPLVPAVMGLAIATYLFILARDERKGRRKYTLFVLSGFFGAVGYLSNPSALLFVIFAALYLIVLGLRNRKTWKDQSKYLSMLAVGFIIGFSITGIYYYTQSGSYLLYPLTDRNVLLEEGNATMNLTSNVQLRWSANAQNTYLQLMLDWQYGPYGKPIWYFGMMFYIFAAMAMLLLIKRQRKAYIFVLMFGFYFLVLSYMPEQVTTVGTLTVIKGVNILPYLLELLVLPMVVVAALGIESLAAGGMRLAKVAALILVLATVAVSAYNLNSDAAYYRAYVYDLHAFLGFAALHPNATFYAYGSFAYETNIMSAFKYDIVGAGCSRADIANESGYAVVGGYVNQDVDPTDYLRFGQCVENNLTAMAPVFYAPDPAYQWSKGDAPPLVVYRVSRAT